MALLPLLPRPCPVPSYAQQRRSSLGLWVSGEPAVGLPVAWTRLPNRLQTFYYNRDGTATQITDFRCLSWCAPLGRMFAMLSSVRQCVWMFCRFARHCRAFRRRTREARVPYARQTVPGACPSGPPAFPFSICLLEVQLHVSASDSARTRLSQVAIMRDADTHGVFEVRNVTGLPRDCAAQQAVVLFCLRRELQTLSWPADTIPCTASARTTNGRPAWCALIWIHDMAPSLRSSGPHFADLFLGCMQKITAETEDGVCMALQHESYPMVCGRLDLYSALWQLPTSSLHETTLKLLCRAYSGCCPVPPRVHHD